MKNNHNVKTTFFKAEQMTILDAELFQKIEIPEVLIWAQEQCEERSPNLTLFTAHFNKLSFW
jgi:Rap guanine nucleotide exchange factor 1